MELTVIPLGMGQSMSTVLAGVIKEMETSGLEYQVTASGTLVEGPMDQLIDLAGHCHLEVRKQTDRVYTLLRLDDFGERTGELKGAVEIVEEKIGRPVRK